MIKARIKVVTTTEFEGTMEADNVDIAIHDAISEARSVGVICNQDVEVLDVETI